jgi:signal transduction histidine kinase
MPDAVNQEAVHKLAEKSLSARSSALWIGFVGLLLLMAGIATDSALSFRNVGDTSTALRQESRQRDALLDQLRIDIYHTGTVVRDYLLEPDDAQARGQKEDLERGRASMARTLAAYEQHLPAAERNTFRDLRQHVDSYWNSLAPALNWSAATRRAQGHTFLREVVSPRRNELVQLARQVTAMNERDLDAGEGRLQSVQAAFRRRVSFISVLALLVGLILAAVSIRRIQRLEREAEQRFAEVEEARGELRKLSERLVNAQEDERRSLSRELHDEVGQSMSAMLVELGRLESISPAHPEYRERLARVRGIAETNVGTVRNMALLLRPSMLDDLGLVPALNWQAREVTRRTGLKVKMIAGEINEDLPDAHRTCVYRVVQEALNNCAKHSQAAQVRVVISQDPSGLSVSVQDDGIGFDPRRQKGLGVLGMEERVERLGGVLGLESQPGHGAILSIRLPLLSPQPAAIENLE